LLICPGGNGQTSHKIQERLKLYSQAFASIKTPKETRTVKVIFPGMNINFK
jgi:hypothetical protein